MLLHASSDHDYVVQLREVDVPTLILWGEQDARFPREEQERLAVAIPGATLKVYPETGHAVHWERPSRSCGIWTRSWKRHVLPSSSSHHVRAAR